MAAAHRLVVANDHSDACEVLARVLELDGHDVLRASTPTEVPDLVTATGVAAVVLDFTVPGHSANLEVTERLRAAPQAEPEADGTSVAIVVVGPTAARALACWQAGVDGYLVRPFHGNDLRRTMYDVLARTATERRIHRNEAQRLLLRRLPR